MWLIQRKKGNQQKDQVEDLLDKDFKIAVLQMLKELQIGVEMVKNKCKNGNISEQKM